MIKKIFKALFCKNNFSTEWRKRNSHNFTIPATNFKMDAVQVGKGTYGNLFVVTRDYQNVKLFIGNYCSIADGVKFLLSGNHQYDISIRRKLVQINIEDVFEKARKTKNYSVLHSILNEDNIAEIISMEYDKEN